ncbi:MAG: hypothetical protein ACJAWL_001930 [Motiliproteus sp.]|jgi:hypothetical protein
MTDSTDNTEAPTLPKRVGVLEQQLHTLHFRVEKFEDTPPRVHTLEQAVRVMQSDWERMRDDIGEIKDSGIKTHESIEQVAEAVRSNGARVSSLFIAGAMVAALMAVVVGGIQVYDSTLSIQQKRQILDPPRSADGAIG